MEVFENQICDWEVQIRNLSHHEKTQEVNWDRDPRKMHRRPLKDIAKEDKEKWFKEETLY